MKRNRHTNVTNDVKETSASKVNEAEQQLVMTGTDGKQYIAKGVKLSPEFKKLAEKLMKEKGVSKESAEAIAKSATIWTPDMVGKNIDEKPVKKTPKTRKPRTKKAVEK